MKKILLVAPEGMAKGGVQAVMMSIAKNLSDAYQFDVLLFTNEKRYYEDEFLTYGGRIFRIPNYEKKNRFRKKADYYVRGHRIYKGVLRILKENGPYIAVHCNNESEAAPILKAASIMGVPIRISHTHRIHGKEHFLYSLLDVFRKKAIERYATTKLGCSEEACESFFANPQDAHVIPNAYDESKFYFIPRKTKDPDGEIKLLQVGSFNPNKNQVFSIQVLAKLSEAHPNVTLSLVGFGDGYREILISEAQKLGCTKSVLFYPHDADIPALLRQSDIFLLPSVVEGFGIALVEAQAVGIKCYASKGVPTEVNCGGVTFLSLEDGPDAWANRIDQDFKKGKTKPRQYDCERYQTKKIVSRYKVIYEAEE